MSPNPRIITLYRGLPGSGCYTWSPFVTKVEARLRFAGIPYTIQAGSLSSAPRGKIPYISLSFADSEPGDSTLIPDSNLIIHSLVEEGVLPELNENMPRAAKANDVAIRALLEEKLYFITSYEKWHYNYYTMRSKILAALPYPMQVIVGLLAYHGNMRTLYGQGTARYTDGERAAKRLEMWESLDALVTVGHENSSSTTGTGDKEDAPFWLTGGNEPSEADAALFGFISTTLICEACPESQRVVRGFPALMDYAKRIHDRYFPDYEFWG